MIYLNHQGFTPDEQDELSYENALDTGQENFTRQEFKEETDINVILSRFGVIAGERQMTWGQEIDYNMDLQSALQLLEDAKRIETQCPPELKSKYPTWRHMVYGIETGEYGMDLSNLAKNKNSPEASSENPTS